MTHSHIFSSVRFKLPVSLLQADGCSMVQEPQDQGTDDHVKHHHGQDKGA